VSLTVEQQATNYQTMLHIQTVQRFLFVMIIELQHRAAEHDQSKLASPEVDIFTEFTPKLAASTYGSDEYKAFLAEMKPALDHHYANNSHHPEHFKNGIEDMNLLDIIEMFCDWKAATLRHNNGNLRKSTEINANRFGMSPQLVKIMENTVGLVE
jgi:hypothetical protein